MNYYFKLQYRCLFRSLKNLGLHPYSIFGLFALGFVLASISLFKKVGYASYLYVLIELSIIYFLGDKTRNEFLKGIFFNQKYRLVRLTENLIYSIPFSIFLIYKQQFLIAVISVILCSAISLFNRVNHEFNYVMPSPFSKYPYEFAIGFRRTYLVLIALYCICIIALVVNNLNLGLFVLAAIFLVCFSFYSELDPIFYVWVHAQSAKSFLRNKIKVAAYYSLWLSLPVAVPLICFYPSNAPIILLILIIGILDVVLSVIAAYTNFPVKMPISHYVQIIFAVCFPPLLLLVIPNLYFQSIDRLKEYLRC